MPQFPGREEDFAVQFGEALDYAVAIGRTAIHCMAGKVPPEQRSAAERTFVANLRRASDRAADKNITLLIEPINPRDRHWTISSPAPNMPPPSLPKSTEPMFVCSSLPSHAQIAGGDLTVRFEKHLPVIAHVQVAAVPSRAEPDDGEVDYPAIFSALDRLGYRGWVGCEYKPRGKTEDGLGWGASYGLGSPG